MTFDIALVLIVLVAAVILFVTELVSVELVSLLAMVVLVLSGVISAEQGLDGFSNEATITIAAMFILSAGLFRTGAVNVIGELMAKVGRHSFWLSLLAFMVVSGIVSAFINNTAVVAIFLPVALSAAQSMKVSPSKLLMPLSYASIFGGCCTLIGTSTNIIVSSIAQEQTGQALGMFDFAPVGLVMFAAGLLYMMTLGVRMIPERRPVGELLASFGSSDYITEIIFPTGSPYIGMAYSDIDILNDTDAEIIELLRNGSALHTRARIQVQHGDILRIRCSTAAINTIREKAGVMLRPEFKLADAAAASEDHALVEAVVAPYSILEGRSLKDINFKERFSAIVLALRHRGTLIKTRLGRTTLRSGDALLIQVPKQDIQELRENNAFVVVSETGIPSFRRSKVVPALFIIAGVITVSAGEILPISIAAIIGCMLMVFTGCLSLQDAYSAIEWEVVLLLAGTLSLGVALESSGAAALLAGFLEHTLGDQGPVALLAVLYIVTLVLTEAMSNNATAALLTPIAIVSARSLELSPTPFIMAVALAASLAFMSPIGYQTHLMVYTPGRYRFIDFIKVGTPLNLLFWILSVVLIPVFFPFR